MKVIDDTFFSIVRYPTKTFSVFHAPEAYYGTVGNAAVAEEAARLYLIYYTPSYFISARGFFECLTDCGLAVKNKDTMCFLSKADIGILLKNGYRKYTRNVYWKRMKQL